MYSTDRKIMPPLWIWLALLLFTLITTIALIRLAHARKKQDFVYRSLYLQHKMQDAKEKFTILFIGTSLTRCGLDSSSTIESVIGGKIDMKVSVIKIWRQGTSIETIIREMPLLQQTHPSVLVVEANMFCYKMKKESTIAEIPTTLNSVVRFRKYSAVYNPDNKPTSSEFREKIIGQKRLGLINVDDLKAFRQFASNLQIQGTKILLINYPYEDDEEHKKWNSSDTAFFNRNLNYLRETLKFRYLNPPIKFDSSYYNDGAHMNIKGCKAYTRWLCDTLSAELNNHEN